MMSTEILQINLAQRIFSIWDEKLLNKIDQLISVEGIVAFDSEGNPLTEKQYIDQIKEAYKDTDAGSSPDEVFKRIGNAYNLE